jgi:hypothetical protein
VESKRSSREGRGERSFFELVGTVGRMSSAVHVVPESFDDLNQILGDENNNNNRLQRAKITPIDQENQTLFNRKKPKKSQNERLDPKPGIWRIFHRDMWYYFLFGKRSGKLAMPFALVAIFFAAFFECAQSPFRYNLYLLLTIEASILFPKFPAKSIRPQFCLTVLTILSFGYDIYLLCMYYYASRVYIILFSVFLLFKFLVFANFLLHVTGAERIRKYMDRRIRLFYVPCHQPKRIMRDVRGRLLALGWLESFFLVGNLVFLIFFYFYYDYKAFYLSTSLVSSLSTFLLIKCITTFLVLSGLLYDTDIRLCMWYFGCLGFAMDYVRKYIRDRKKKLGGFPLVFSFYSLRFQILFMTKILDILCGLYGWFLIFPFLFLANSVENELEIFVSLLSVFLFFSDFYVLVLFLGIRWLLRRQKVMEKLKLAEQSEDSEVEEFQLNKSEDEEESNKDSGKRKKNLLPTNSSDFMKDLEIREPQSLYPLKKKGRLPKKKSSLRNLFKQSQWHSSDSSDNDDNPEMEKLLVSSPKKKRKPRSSKDGRILVDEEEIDILDAELSKNIKRKKKRRSDETTNPIHLV